MKPSRSLIPLADFQRIFQVAHGIIREVGKDPSKSCILFSMVGACLLNVHYSINARPVVGAAFYKLDASDRVLSIADMSSQEALSSIDGFHCWVQANGWCLDFASPLFPEIASQAGFAGMHERRAFQKAFTANATSPAELASPGDFYVEANVDLTRQILMENIQSDTITDLLNIARLWYRKPPRSIDRKMVIRNDLGKVLTLKLDSPLISGVW